ncbi:hypothetical protein ScPMuIL_011247 [Solemya velum]
MSPRDQGMQMLTLKAAVESSRVFTTTLIGEDTDFLFLLLYCAKTENEAADNLKDLTHRHSHSLSGHRHITEKGLKSWSDRTIVLTFRLDLASLREKCTLLPLEGQQCLFGLKMRSVFKMFLLV